MPHLAGGKEARRLTLVRVHGVAPPRPVDRDIARSWVRVASVATDYLGRGLRSLGQHSTSYVWTPETGEVRADPDVLRESRQHP